MCSILFYFPLTFSRLGTHEVQKLRRQKQGLKKAWSEDFPGGPTAKTAAFRASCGAAGMQSLQGPVCSTSKSLSRQSVQSPEVLQLTPHQVGMVPGEETEGTGVPVTQRDVYTPSHLSFFVVTSQHGHPRVSCLSAEI